MHEFSLTADALLASFAKPRCCGGEIYRCSKGRLTDGARQLRLDACRTGSARDSAASMVSMSTRGNHPIVACAGRFGCMGASPLRLSFYQPYPHRPPNRAGPKRKRIPYLVERCIGSNHQRLAGPFAHFGPRKQARAKRGTGPSAKPKPR